MSTLTTLFFCVWRGPIRAGRAGGDTDSRELVRRAFRDYHDVFHWLAIRVQDQCVELARTRRMALEALGGDAAGRDIRSGNDRLQEDLEVLPLSAPARPVFCLCLLGEQRVRPLSAVAAGLRWVYVLF